MHVDDDPADGVDRGGEPFVHALGDHLRLRFGLDVSFTPEPARLRVASGRRHCWVYEDQDELLAAFRFGAVRKVPSGTVEQVAYYIAGRLDVPTG